MKILITLLLLLTSILGYSQQPKDTINYKNVNIIFLEKLLKEKIDIYRKNNNIHQLTWIDSLSKECGKHNKKMSEKGYVFHDKTGGCIEICCYVYYNNKTTYESITNNIFNLILSSKPHKEILSSPNNLGGVGIFFDSTSKRFYLTYRGDSNSNGYTEEELDKIVKNMFKN